jgi:hypothetical protein
MAEYFVTIEYLINENVNIKRLDDKIEYLLADTNGKLTKSDIIYNTNKRYKIFTKDTMFNNNIVSFNKFIEMKKFINNLFKTINNFEKKNLNKLTNITRYCSKTGSKKKTDDKEIFNKFENNIIIANIDKHYTKYNKKKIDNLFSIKNLKEDEKISTNNTNNTELNLDDLLNLENLEFGTSTNNGDKYKILKKYIVEYYMKNNIIN